MYEVKEMVYHRSSDQKEEATAKLEQPAE